MSREITRLLRGGALSCLTFLMLAVTVRAGEGTAIPWRDDYGRALAEARAQNRALWIQFTGPWCPWCVRMERDTFSHPKVATLARDALVPVLLRSDVHEQLALQCELSGLPATVLINPKGEIIAKHEGYLDPAAFHAYVVECLTRFSLIPAREEPKVVRTVVPPVGLDGYCTVNLVAFRRLVEGKKEFSLTHEGRVYRFENAEMRTMFQKEPERYIPVNGGRCPVSQVDQAEARAGIAQYGVLYEGHLFVCSDDANRQLFLKNPQRYARVDVVDRGFCPHCWTRDALVVRGRPEHSLTRSGQRFFFPDSSHREAFRIATDSIRR